MSVRDKWVRRFSIDETAKHKNGFTIYKITSVLFPLESPEAVTVVSVWKRYSDVQRLHKSMRSLHSGLHLRGTFPTLAKSSFFKRFQQEIIEERAKSIKTLLEFVAEHRLLFTSTDFVNFLQTGYPEPEPKTGVINAIRSSLHLPIEETPPLEYQTSDDDTRSPTHSVDSNQERRAIIKEKTNKYLSYAETIYNNYLCDAEQSVLPEQEESRRTHWPLPLSMVRRATDELACYRVLGVLAPATMLVLHDGDQTCYAMKVVQKIPNNLTEFDDFFLQRISETRQPVLPTVIPYMVPLHALIETNHLYFLILSYAPGKKLFEYIKNYANSIPNTPARQVNLENVFSEPIAKKNDIENNITEDIEANLKVNTDYLDSVNKNVDKLDNVEVSVNELVMNSQKLLLNVDRVLSEVGGSGVGLGVAERDGDSGQSEREDTERVNTLGCRRLTPNPRDLLPPSAVCKWGAEILTALESLHNCGVVCRDLNPSNILLGDRGQIILTYFLYYPGVDMALAMIHRHTDTPDMYIAPELYTTTCVEGDGALDRVCDFWSFGAVMYELLCGVPLSHYHRSVFTSHTILQLPDGLPVEVQSLLTQLLTYEPAERLGAGKTGIAEIKQHPYFKHIDWQQVYDAWIAPA
ncbi:ribosomal protein S6 kinase-like 1 isoform X3 [Epargyreus clarus]|uniref:ribosomal protein S6 kinase-like 1 isoform X3 n=1 Tax=Epargyreus clarus TaxID=520877 RepID=UPI003C2C8914